MFVITKKEITKALIILLAVVFIPFASRSDEKEIKIGYNLISERTVQFYFNVPVTKEMVNNISKQEGVDAVSFGLKYDLTIVTAQMFSRQEVINNIIKALEAEIFAGKSVKFIPSK
jgi:hypothetical protein